MNISIALHVVRVYVLSLIMLFSLKKRGGVFPENIERKLEKSYSFQQRCDNIRMIMTYSKKKSSLFRTKDICFILLKFAKIPSYFTLNAANAFKYRSQSLSSEQYNKVYSKRFQKCLFMGSKIN